MEAGADGTPDNISPVNRDPLAGEVKGIMEFGIMEFGPSALEKNEVALLLSFFSALLLIQILVLVLKLRGAE